MPAHYESVLRHAENLPEEGQRTGAAAVEETATGVVAQQLARRAQMTILKKTYSWESWNRFFYALHGREGLGYGWWALLVGASIPARVYSAAGKARER